jgi:2-oxoisovalerate dehydrogenase E1 component alpha subunit
MTLRAFDARMQMAQRQGKTSFYMQHMGEEAVSCAFRKALEPGDMNFPTYRQAGLLIAGGYPMVDMMNQIYSNEADPLKGRQLPIMYSSKDHGFFSISGNLGTQYRAGGRLGDGVGHQGRHQDRRRLDRRRLDRRKRFPRGAGVRLDLQGAGHPQHRQQPVGDLDLPGHRARRLRHVCGARPRFRHSGAARRRQRLSRRPCGRQMGGRAGARNLGPTLVEYVTYRVGAHSTSDDPSAYRPKTESDAWPLGDPVIRLKNHLIARRLVRRAPQAGGSRDHGRGDGRAEGGRRHGTLHAGGKPSARDMFEGVYEEMPPHLRRQRQQAGV